MRALLLVLILLASALAATPDKPNLVLILADDLGIGHVGAYGQRKIRTPNLDQLAAEGMRFNRFYSGANVCAPARSTLITGLHTGHTAVRNNGLDRHLHDADVTLAEVLRAAGYATGGFGKWGLGRPDTPGVAVRQGFDTWFGQYSQVHAHFYYPYFLMRDLEKFPLPQNEGRQRGRYAQDEIHDQAMAYITSQARAKRPFFAYLPYILPHVELTCPEDSWAPYKGLWPKLPRPDPRPGYLGSDDAHAEFAGMVSRLDRQVGELLALLQRLGIDDNTLVIFTSDNGPQPGAWKDIFVDFFDGAAGLRGSKTNFYEGGIREPMLARWPGHIRPGSVTDHVGYFPDFMPTLAEIAGASAHLPATDGISFAPTLFGRPGQKTHDFLYWEAAGADRNTVQQAVRWGDWKAVKPGARAAWELYNLKQDERETTDVAARHPDVMRQIAAIVAREHTPERAYAPAIREGVADFVR